MYLQIMMIGTSTYISLVRVRFYTNSSLLHECLCDTPLKPNVRPLWRFLALNSMLCLVICLSCLKLTRTSQHYRCIKLLRVCLKPNGTTIPFVS